VDFIKQQALTASMTLIWRSVGLTERPVSDSLRSKVKAIVRVFLGSVEHRFSVQPHHPDCCGQL